MAKSNRNKPSGKLTPSTSSEEKSKPKPRRRKKKKIDIKRYLMIGMIGLAMIAFIFTSLPSNIGGNTKSKSRPAPTTNSTPSSTTSPSNEPAFKEEGKLQFVSGVDGSTIRDIKLEIADDEPQRVQGMMYRKSIPNDTGMLFVFDDEAPRSFWMKNTYVSLDILFVDANKKILNIHENTTTLSEQMYPSTAPAKYVVEVAGGYTAAYGIKAGDLINFSK